MSLMGKLQMLEFTLPSREVWSANWEVPRERILTLFVKGTKARCTPSEWRASSRIDWYKQRNSKRYKCWMLRSTDEGRGNQRKADAYNCIKYTQFHQTHSRHHTAHNTDASVAVADHIFHLFRLCLLFSLLLSYCHLPTIQCARLKMGEKNVKCEPVRLWFGADGRTTGTSWMRCSRYIFSLL